MNSKKIKDFDSIEESQKIKGSNDLESNEIIESQSQKNYKLLIIIIVALFLFFGLIFILFIIQLNKHKARLKNSEFQQFQQNIQMYQNFRDNQKGINQTIQQNESQSDSNSLDQNLQVILAEALNQTYNIIHRNHTNIPISELLPKIKKKKVNNISEILKSKTLNIKDKKITKEYIQFIKPLNETIEDKYKQILFPDLIFDNYSFVHIYNYSMYLSYLNKTKKKIDSHKLKKVKVNITKNNSIFSNKSVNNLTNQSLLNSINITNNQTLNNISNVIINQTLNNTINKVDNQTLNITINMDNNQTLNNTINIDNNQTLNNTINIDNNQTLNITINMDSNQTLNNTIINDNNQTLNNAINSVNNQTLNNTINMNSYQALNNTINNDNNQALYNKNNTANNQTSNNPINSINNQNLNNLINDVSNQLLSNTINNSNNLTNQINNSHLNTTHGLRNLELNNTNSSYLRDFYLACDRRKLIIVKKNKSESYEDNAPFISVIIPFFNKKLELLRTIRSVQLQTLKNIEIIIVDDENTSAKKYYKKILDNDYRIRLFTQNKNLGVWRKRIDGFLYSRGEYILHINPGDILSDSYVLEDLYNLVHKYNLDTVRFSFSKTNYDSKFKKNLEFNEKRIYPNKFTKIIYGTPGYNVHIFGYGTIYNRLVRSGIFRKALDLVDIDILNVHKDIWEDMWWNDLIDRVSFSNLVVNRLGYIFLYDLNNVLEPRSTDKFLREKTIREFILFWLFDLKLLPQDNNKQMIIDNIKQYIRPDNKFGGETVSLEYLIHRYEPYEILLASLIEVPSVSIENRVFVYKLYQEIKKKKKN